MLRIRRENHAIAVNTIGRVIRGYLRPSDRR